MVVKTLHIHVVCVCVCARRVSLLNSKNSCYKRIRLAAIRTQSSCAVRDGGLTKHRTSTVRRALKAIFS